MPLQPRSFKADHPFLFMIQLNNLPLFVGVVADKGVWGRPPSYSIPNKAFCAFTYSFVVCSEWMLCALLEFCCSCSIFKWTFISITDLLNVRFSSMKRGVKQLEPVEQCSLLACVQLHLQHLKFGREIINSCSVSSWKTLHYSLAISEVFKLLDMHNIRFIK